MLASNYDIFVDHAANNKMFGHIRFLARVSVPAARRLRVALQQSIDDLKINPERFPPYISNTNVTAELRYNLCDKRYRIVFEIIENTVFVYDIQDCRQDNNKNFV